MTCGHFFVLPPRSSLLPETRGVAVGTFKRSTTLFAKSSSQASWLRAIFNSLLLTISSGWLTSFGFAGNAVFFLLLNWFKVPFMVNLKLINPESLWLNLQLAPAVIVGCVVGCYAASWMNQRVFESTALGLTFLAAVKLLVF